MLFVLEKSHYPNSSKEHPKTFEIHQRFIHPFLRRSLSLQFKFRRLNLTHITMATAATDVRPRKRSMQEAEIDGPTAEELALVCTSCCIRRLHLKYCQILIRKNQKALMDLLRNQQRLLYVHRR